MLTHGRVGVALASLGLLVAACGGPSGSHAIPDLPPLPGVERPSPDSPDVEQLVAGINDVGYRLFQAALSGADSDVTLSPLSIGLAFGMADAGASGATAEALAALFAFPVDSEARWAAFNTLDQSVTSADDPVVRVANRLFPESSFEVTEGYDERLAQWFGARMEPLPLRADPEGSRKHINRWVADETDGLIPDLLQSVSHEAALLLVNTLYLEARWSQPFADALTDDAPFHRLDGSTSTVTMMHAPRIDAVAAVTDDYAAVQLPYEGGELSMLIVVPSIGQYRAIEAGLEAVVVDEIDSGMTQGTVEFFLPRFESEISLHLRELLEDELGVADLFGVPGFAGIGPDLTLEDAVHATHLLVDEHGTVAAAATALDIDGSDEPVDPTFTVRADRPFLYVIRHHPTGAVLFVGRILDPPTGPR